VRVRNVRRMGGLALLAATTAAILSGCGGSTAKPAASATNTAGASSIQAYVACLNKNGVTIAQPSGSPGGGARPSRAPGTGNVSGGGGGGGGIFNDASNPPTGVSASAWTAALAACKSLQPTGGGGGGAGGGGSTAFTAYANCLKSHGITTSGGANSLNTTDPKTAAAMKTCAPLRPTGAPSGAPSANG
jgi:hypothetical protein